MDLIEYSPPELPAGVADRIAAAVGVGQAQTPRFAAALAGLFALARNNHAWDINSAQHRDLADIQLSELRELLTKLAKQIDKLAPSSRRHFGLFALHQRHMATLAKEQIDPEIANDPRWKWLIESPYRKKPLEGAALRMQLMDLVEGGGMEQGESIVSDYRAIVGEMLAAASMSVWPKRGDGRPPKRLLERPPDEVAGHPAIKAFDIFVVELVKLVVDCGGRPTLNKNTGTGKLISALRAAQPHLPRCFIPDGLLEPDEDGKLSGLSHLSSLRQKALRRHQAQSTGQKPPRK